LANTTVQSTAESESAGESDADAPLVTVLALSVQDALIRPDVAHSPEMSTCQDCTPLCRRRMKKII